MSNGKLKVLFLMVAFNALVVNVFGQLKAYPFEVKKSGKGKQAVVLMPGFASNGAVWDDTRAILEDHYTCYTLTMAGFAGAAPQADPTFAGWEQGIADYIGQNHLGKIIFIGHSMGAGMAMALAADHPDLIAKIIAVDGLPCLAALMNNDFKSNENNDCTPTVNRMMATSDKDFYAMQKMSIPRLLADTAKQEMVVGWSMKSDRKTFAQMYCDFSNTDLRERIGKIDCPSLILLEAPFANMKETIEGQFSKLKTADLRYAAKGLHFVMYDDKEWYMQQIKSFLK